MSIRPVALLLFSLSLLTAIPSAFAAEEPIPGVDVIVRRRPPVNFPTINAETNDKGSIDLPRLQPGNYELVIDAKSLLAATTASGHTPTPNDNPITSINITLPSNPDAKLATSPDVSAGTAIAFTIPKGKLGVHIEIGQSMQSRTSKLSTPDDNKTPTSTPPPPSPQSIGGVPIQGTPIPIEHDPDGLAAQNKGSASTCTKATCQSNAKQIGLAITDSSVQNTSASILTGPCRPPYLCLNAIDLVVKDSKGKTVGHGKTDANGTAFIKLTQKSEGPLTLAVDGKSLVAVMDKLYPQTAPAKTKSSGSSFSLGLGVGGFGNSGSTRSTTTAGSGGAGAGKPDVRPAETTTTTNSGGGGIGLTIPVTLHGKSKSETTTTTATPPPSIAILIALLLPAVQNAIKTNQPVITKDVENEQASNTYTGPTTVNAGTLKDDTITKNGPGTLTLSAPNSLTTNPTTQTPYSRDTASKGLSVPFTVAKDSTDPITVRLSSIQQPQPPSPASIGGVPIQGTPIPIEHDPDGLTVQSNGTTTSTSTCKSTSCLSNLKQMGMAVEDSSGQILTGPCKPPYLCLTGVEFVIKNGAGQVVGHGKTSIGTDPIRIAQAQENDSSLTVEIDGKSLASAVSKATPSGATPQIPLTRFTVTMIPNPNAYQGTTSVNAGILQHKTEFTAEIPYCSGTASQNTHLTVPLPNVNTGSGPQATATELGVVVFIMLGWGIP